MRKLKREKSIVVINEIGDKGRKVVEAIHESPFLAEFIWHTNKSRFRVSLGMTPQGEGWGRRLVPNQPHAPGLDSATAPKLR